MGPAEGGGGREAVAGGGRQEEVARGVWRGAEAGGGEAAVAVCPARWRPQTNVLQCPCSKASNFGVWKRYWNFNVRPSFVQTFQERPMLLPLLPTSFFTTVCMTKSADDFVNSCSASALLMPAMVFMSVLRTTMVVQACFKLAARPVKANACDALFLQPLVVKRKTVLGHSPSSSQAKPSAGVDIHETLTIFTTGRRNYLKVFALKYRGLIC